MRLLIVLSLGILAVSVIIFILKESNYFKSWQRVIIGAGISYFGVFELFHLGSVPGLYGDEAFNFYNAWSIAHYGVDAHLLHNAVYSLASGGQSVLYEYLVSPFMKIFGMNLVAYRYPVAVLSILSIVLLLYALYKNNIESNVITGITLSISTAEWLLMYCHWAMDCNIVVPFFIFMIDFVLLGLVESKYNGYIALVFVSLMEYCYVGSWIVLPWIYLLILVIMSKANKFNKIDVIINVAVDGFISIPIFCYILVQFLGVKPFKFLWFTVMAIPETRVNASMVKFNSDIVNNIINNIAQGVGQLITGNDNLIQTSVPGYSIMTLIASILLVWGITSTLSGDSSKRLPYQFLLMLLLAMLPMIMLVQPNFNHWAIVMIIIYVWAGVGLGRIFDKKVKIVTGLIVAIIVLVTAKFTNYYFTNYSNDEIKVNQVSKYAINYDNSKRFVKFIDSFHARVYYGFPFYNSNVVEDNIEFLECIKQISPYKINLLKEKYRSYLPKELHHDSVYIVPKGQEKNYPYLRTQQYKEYTINANTYFIYYIN